MYDDFGSVSNYHISFWINLDKFCIFENALYNGKDYFLQVKSIPMGNSFSSASANIYCLITKKKLLIILLLPLDVLMILQSLIVIILRLFLFVFILRN